MQYGCFVLQLLDVIVVVLYVSKSKGVSKLRKTSTLVLVLFLSIVSITSGCDIEEPNSEQLEQQRIDLYIEVMSSVFQEENGGSDFIAIDLDTLEGLSSEGKNIVLETFKDFSPNVYDFEDIKNDESKFQFDGEHLLGTINGSLLWIELKEYKDKSAKIIGTSWFGNLGSVSIEYNAKLKNENWELTEVSMSIS